MSIPIWLVDSFSAEPFSGNPAAVCVLPSFTPNQWMQDVATEMNLSETAFLVRDDADYHLRWFTPVAEVKLCGHATLASAHILWENAMTEASEPIRFHTQSGVLTAGRRDQVIELDFPARPPVEVTAPPSGLTEALGIDPVWTGRDEEDFIVVAASESDVREVSPDFRALRRVTARGIMVTAVADDGDIDFVSRFFAPAFGVDEDPVTGSAHCCLTPYWAHQLGKDRMVGFQASKRGGTVHVKMAGDRVLLGGEAVTTLRGELLV